MKRRYGLFLTVWLCLTLVLGACTPTQPAPAATSTTGGEATGLPGTGGTGTATGEAQETAPATLEGTGTPETTPFPSVTATTTDTTVTPFPSVTATTMAVPSGTVTATVTASPTGTTGLVSLSQVFNAKVQNQNVETLGQVEDVAVNLGAATVDYVIVRLGDTTGAMTGTLPVPWRAFRFTDQEGGERDLILDIEGPDLDAAPAIDLSKPAPTGPAQWDTLFGEYWNTVLGETAPSATPTPGSSAGSKVQGIVLAKSLLTTDILGTGDVKLGKVTDFLIEAGTGRVSYLLVSGEAALGSSGGSLLIPIPFGLTTVANDLSLQLPLDLETLSKAPNFSLQDLPDLSNQNWDELIRQFWQTITTP